VVANVASVTRSRRRARDQGQYYAVSHPQWLKQPLWLVEHAISCGGIGHCLLAYGIAPTREEIANSRSQGASSGTVCLLQTHWP
jgi:hypothetical protein